MTFFAKAASAALIALGTITMSVSTADAQWREPGRGPDWGHHRPPVGRCYPEEALEKARWDGLRRPRIVNVTPRNVVVEGRYRGGWDRMVFANVRGCPIVRR